MTHYLLRTAAALLLLSTSAAQAGVIDLTGADLASAPFASFPNGPGTVSGTSLDFPGAAPDNRVAISIDLAALGFGLGGATVGSVAVTNTRLTTDSDLRYGLYDGVAADFPNFTSFDGDRSQDQTICSATTDGLTFVPCSGPSTSFVTIQNVGDAATALFEFDLLAGTLGFSINGVVSASVIPGGLDLNNLSFLVGLGSINEDHRIDRVAISGVPMGVPEPATLALLGLGLIGSAGMGRRRGGIA